MKRLFALVLAATLAAPTIAAAGFQGPNSAQGGGFQGPTTGIEADTVAKAQKAGTMPASCSPGTSPNVLPAATINTSSRTPRAK